ncbi:MAG: cation:proton antiporter, partial [Candidatus Aenigmatarchaeota archaeon]
MPFDLTLTMTYFGFLLGIGVIAANLLKKINLPDTLFLLLLGLLLGPTIFNNPLVTKYMDVTLVDVNAMGQVPDFLRTLALILIVFMGTFNLSWRVFKRLSDLSVKLAFVGTIFNTLVLGLAASLIFGLNPIYALLLAAIISGTEGDVISVFERSLSKFKETITIIKIEAILNSPLTILFPFIFLDMVKLQPGALFEPLKYLSQFWLMIAAGIGTGIIIGLAVGKLIRKVTKEYTALLLLSIALITYALAENVGGSGILAVAVCGLVAGNMVLKPEEKEIVTGFENQLAEMLRISVFMLLGAQ